MQNENVNVDEEFRNDLNEIKTDVNLLRKQLYTDDITESKNRLWVFKQKLNNTETFNDFGFLVSIKIVNYESILKEYESNVANRLLTQVSNYMMHYMEDNRLSYEIVRYLEDNFLIFMYGLNEERVEEYILNMQQGMSNYKFKHRSKIFNLAFYSAVMQYIKNESFSSVLDQLDAKLFDMKV